MSSIDQTYAPSRATQPDVAGVLADRFPDTAEGMHDAIHAAAEKAASGARRVDKAATGAAAPAHLTTELLRAVGDELIAGLRHNVRVKPLTSVASAMALGGVLAGLLRMTTRSKPPTHLKEAL